MSKYTTEVRYICETYSGATESVGFNGIEEILNNSWDKVFDFDFPMFDENYRQALCTKILRHFYTREIGEETVGLWKLRLNARLNDIMPYYNKLYESETIKINPLYTFNLSKSHKDSGGDVRIMTESGTENSVTDGTNKSVNSGSDSVAIEGTNTSTDSGNDTVSIEGSNTITNSGTDSVSAEGTNRTADSGTDSVSAEGTNRTADSGSDTIIGGSSVNNTTQNETKGITSNTVVTTKTETLKDRYSDTPQGGINGIESDTYLTNARLNDNNINQNDTNNGSTSGNSKEVSTGESNLNQSTTYGKISDNSNTSTESTTYGKISDTSNTSTESTTYGKVTNNANNSSQNTTYKKSTSNNNQSSQTTTFGKQTNNTITNIIDVTNSKNTSDTITTTRENIENVMGSSGKSDSELLLEYRSTFLNIDMQVINELNDLFFNLW